MRIDQIYIKNVVYTGPAKHFQKWGKHSLQNLILTFANLEHIGGDPIKNKILKNDIKD